MVYRTSGFTPTPNNPSNVDTFETLHDGYSSRAEHPNQTNAAIVDLQKTLADGYAFTNILPSASALNLGSDSDGYTLKYNNSTKEIESLPVIPAQSGSAGLPQRAGSTYFDTLTKKLTAHNGSIFTSVGGGLSPVLISTATPTAVENGTIYLVDTQSNIVTLTVGNGGVALNQFAFKDRGGALQTYSLRIQFTGVGGAYIPNLGTLAQNEYLLIDVNGANGQADWDGSKWIVSFGEYPSPASIAGDITVANLKVNGTIATTGTTYIKDANGYNLFADDAISYNAPQIGTQNLWRITFDESWGTATVQIVFGGYANGGYPNQMYYKMLYCNNGTCGVSDINNTPYYANNKIGTSGGTKYMDFILAEIDYGTPIYGYANIRVTGRSQSSNSNPATFGGFTLTRL